MPEHAWVKEFVGAITVCDREGVILEMNDHADETFHSDGGRALIGSNALDCHPEPDRTKMKGLLKMGQKNVYTIEKQGVKKIIYQAPWYQNGQYCGFVELSLEIPAEMPHFVRK